jgi:Rrf2 family protein
MLRISRRADYAVRVMIAISQRTGDDYIPAPLIGEQMTIPQSFLVKVIGDLRRSGLITTVAGRKGGVKLAREAGAINLRQIVEAVEGPIVLNTCLVRPAECPRDQNCPAHDSWEHIQRVLHQEMDAINLIMLREQSAGS